MGRIYILPCAGYDRPGGEVSRAAAERLVKSHDDVIIGSMGALFTERPGEMRDFRTSDIIILDGCSTNCASKLIQQRRRDDVTSISIPEICGSESDFEKKVNLTVNAVEDAMQKIVPKASAVAPTFDSESEIEYLEEKFDKFVLRIAKDHKYSDNDFWVRIEGENVRVGASDFLQQMMSDVYYIDVAEPGTHVDMFDDVGAMESTKILVEIIVPVSGTIVKANESLVDSPEFINESPYDKGWLYLIKPDDLDELELLRDSQDYMNYALEKAKEEIGKKVE